MQCICFTKKNVRCKVKILNGDIYCHHHKKNKIKVEEVEEEDEKDDDTLECQCCFTKLTDTDRIIRCNRYCKKFKHVFCKDCISGYIEANINTNTSTINCMLSPKSDKSFCCGTYNYEDIKYCIKLDQFEQFEIQCQSINVKYFSTILTNYQICPKCEKFGIIVEDKTIKNLKCECCSYEWCINCKQLSHIGDPCFKFKDSIDISILNKTVDEILSKSLSHTCPSCNTLYIKEEGCNAITCSNCKKHSCYLCGIDISNLKDGKYEHFRTSKCELWNDRNDNNHGNLAFNKKKAILECEKLLDINKDNKIIYDILKTQMLKHRIDIKVKEFKEPKIPKVKIPEIKNFIVQDFKIPEIQALELKAPQSKNNFCVIM